VPLCQHCLVRLMRSEVSLAIRKGDQGLRTTSAMPEILQIKITCVMGMQADSTANTLQCTIPFPIHTTRRLPLPLPKLQLRL